MPSSVSVKGNMDGLDKILKNVSKNLVAKIGIFGGSREDGETNASIGAKHEFGSFSKNLPRRSFLKDPLSLKRKDIVKKARLIIADNITKPEGASKIFELIREVGGEFGATTGRPRQIGWLDIDDIKKGININGVNKLIINKIDVLEKVKTFNIKENGNLLTFKDKRLFKGVIVQQLLKDCPTLTEVIFSESPYEI